MISFVFKVKNLFGKTILTEEAFIQGVDTENEAMEQIKKTVLRDLGSEAHSLAVWFNYENPQFYWENSPVVAILGNFKQW